LVDSIEFKNSVYLMAYSNLLVPDNSQWCTDDISQQDGLRHITWKS